MNTKIIIVAVLVLLLGYGVFYLSTEQATEPQSINNSDTGSSAETNEDNQVGVETDTEMMTSGTFADIRQREGDFRCDFRTEITDEGVTQTQEGVVYSSGDRMRIDGTVSADIQLTADGSNTMDLSMIIVDDVMYNWSDRGAIKMTLSDLEGTDTEVSATTEGSPMDLYDQTVQYDCAPWTVDESVFALPDDVEFMDMNEIMDGMMNGLELPEELISQ